MLRYQPTLAMTTTSTVQTYVAEKHGVFICGGLIVFFFIMRIFDLLYIVELRAMNFFIMTAGILMAIKTLRRIYPDRYTYFQGMGTGILTGIIGSVLFALFVFFYVSFLDTGLMQSIIENEPMGRFMNPYIVAVIIAVEGIASALLISFIIMNYLDPHKME